MKPYGLATEKVTTDLMKRRLQPFTCELLRRPGVGVSQFAQTISDNYERLNCLDTLMTSDRINDYMVLLAKLHAMTIGLNMKQDTIKGVKLRKSVKSLIKHVAEKKEKLLDIFMHLGASMYLVGLHYKVFQFCIKNTKWIKTKVKGKGTFTKTYKQWLQSKTKDVKSVSGYIDEVVREIEKSGKKEVSMRFSASETDSESECEDERKRKKKEKKKIVVTSGSENESEEGDEKTNKRKKKNEKRRVVSSGSESECEESDGKKKNKKKERKESSGESDESDDENDGVLYFD